MDLGHYVRAILSALFLLTVATPVISQQGGDVRIKREGQWVTVQLPLLRQKTFDLPDGTKGLALESGGMLDGKQVLLWTLIDMKWEEQKPQGMPFSFWWSEIALERVGPPTDELVRVLAGLYGVTSPTRAKNQVGFRVVSLGTNPNSKNNEWKLKAFYEGKGESEYAEFYFNVNFDTKIVEFSEKDPEYRPAIIKALGVVE